MPAVAAMVIKPCEPLVPMLQPVLVVTVMTPAVVVLMMRKSNVVPTFAALSALSRSTANGRVYAAVVVGVPMMMPLVNCAAVSVALSVAVAGAAATEMETGFLY